jgi:hypothetical protein
VEDNKSDYSRIKYICLLFSGRIDPVTGEVGSVFDCEELKQIPDVIPRATLSAAESLQQQTRYSGEHQLGLLQRL